MSYFIIENLRSEARCVEATTREAAKGVVEIDEAFQEKRTYRKEGGNRKGDKYQRQRFSKQQLNLNKLSYYFRLKEFSGNLLGQFMIFQNLRFVYVIHE